MNSLSVSVTAERLLYRSKAEPDNGDYSLAIVIAVMAIESFLTRLYLKLKSMGSYLSSITFPTAAQEADWEEEYPRSGGFSSPIGLCRNGWLARPSISLWRTMRPQLAISCASTGRRPGPQERAIRVCERCPGIQWRTRPASPTSSLYTTSTT